MSEILREEFAKAVDGSIEQLEKTNRRIMKVELQCGDTITIPEGCKAIIKDGIIEIEKEEKEEVQEFKDGDVLHSVYDGTMLIFKKYSTYYSFTSHYSTLYNIGLGWAIKSFRHATEEEKQLLFDKMQEQGLHWNAEEKRVENIRWRAEDGKIYYYVSSEMNVSSTCRPKKGVHLYDHEGNSYLSYNYFRTKEQAEEAARRVKEALRKFHEEIEE